MVINPSSSAYQPALTSTTNTVKATDTAKVSEAKENSNTSSAAVYELTDKTEDKNKFASKTKAKADPAEVSRLLEQSQQQVDNFKTMISSLISKQAGSARTAIDFENGSNLGAKIAALKVDPETAAKAKADVAEDGYYGVKNTSDRILNFAKAVAGSDPKKLAEMRKATEQGFKVAEQMWGDKMPDITKQTYDAVMSGFDALQGITKE